MRFADPANSVSWKRTQIVAALSVSENLPQIHPHRSPPTPTNRLMWNSFNKEFGSWFACEQLISTSKPLMKIENNKNWSLKDVFSWISWLYVHEPIIYWTSALEAVISL